MGGAGALASIGGSLASAGLAALGGKGGGDTSGDKNPYADAAAYLSAADYEGRTYPRGLVQTTYKNLYDQSVNGTFQPEKLPMYSQLFGLQKKSLESQYQQAKQNIMAGTPEGGNLTGALSNLENSRASTMGALPAELGANIYKDLFDKAATIGFGGTPTSIAGLTSLANSQNAMTGAQLQANAMSDNANTGIMAMLGRGIGQGMGSLAGKGANGIASGGVSK